MEAGNVNCRAPLGSSCPKSPEESVPTLAPAICSVPEKLWTASAKGLRLGHGHRKSKRRPRQRKLSDPRRAELELRNFRHLEFALLGKRNPEHAHRRLKSDLPFGAVAGRVLGEKRFDHCSQIAELHR